MIFLWVTETEQKAPRFIRGMNASPLMAHGWAGQSHLIYARQNALEIGSVPSSLEPLGMNPNPRRVFLTQ